MMRAILFGAGLAVLALVSGANAEECAGVPNGQVGLNECYADVFKKADAELNILYKEIEGRLSGDADRTKLLVTAQRAWVAYRDGECAFESSAVAGGSMEPMVYSMCRTGLTRSRVQDFKRFLACEESDVTCPVPAN